MNADPPTDAQASGLDNEIIGDTSNPSFYKSFYDGGTPGIHTDGNLAFRIRMAGDKNAGFDNVGFVGMDANGNGGLDLFFAVDRSGSQSQLSIYAAGAGANTSPNTTSIASSPLYSEPISASNFDWAPIDSSRDSTATSFNLDNGSGGGAAFNHTDHFLSFVLPFSQLVAAAASLGINMTDESAFSFIAVSSQQTNALNGDLNGVNGTPNGNTTWAQLGAMTQAYTPTGTAPVPEPDAHLLLAVVGLFIILRTRRRAQHQGMAMARASAP